VKTVVHLSDLHFGRVDARLLLPLAARVNQLAPDLVAVSGDLTQRAKPAQFQAARAWLDTLQAPKLIVPGNHDISLYNVFNRFLRPLANYRRYIDARVETDYVDAEIAVAGINSARSLTFKDGRINQAQLERLRARLGALPAARVRIVVSHHPFTLPAAAGEGDIVGRARLAMQVFHALGVDLLLSGHMHASLAGSTAERWPIDGYAALVVQAGTATSTRGRGESNAFNLLRIDGAAPGGPRVEVERHGWDDGQRDYLPAERQRFVRGSAGWEPARTA
jgi:3',5'-cyclic AMP phosphodiesterase CpdA